MNFFQKENLSQDVITPWSEYQTKEEKRIWGGGGRIRLETMNVTNMYIIGVIPFIKKIINP
jgi:hypothetical protein